MSVNVALWRDTIYSWLIESLEERHKLNRYRLRSVGTKGRFKMQPLCAATGAESRILILSVSEEPRALKAQVKILEGQK